MTAQIQRRANLTSIAVFACGLVLTGVVTTVLFQITERNALDHFHAHVDRLESEIKHRMGRAEFGLKWLRSAVGVTGRMDRAGFRASIAARDLPREYPGIQGMGYIERVPRAELDAFVRRERADGAPDFTLRTSGQGAELLVIKYIEPAADNAAAWGFDIASEPVRREAAERAAATGDITLSGSVALLRDPQAGRGWLMLLPVFRRPAATPEERRAALVGYFYAPLVIQDLLGDLGGTTSGELGFQLFDGSSETGRLLFDGASRALPAASLRLMDSATPRHTLDRGLQVGGHVLTLRASTTPLFERGIERMVPLAAGLAGLLLSLCIALVVRLLLLGRARALALAETMTQDLGRLAKVVQHTSNAVAGLDIEQRVLWINEGFTRVTGYTLEDCQGEYLRNLLRHSQGDGTTRRLLRHARERMEGCRAEILCRRKDGSGVWVDVEIQPTHDARGEVNGWIGIGQDITHRRQAEEARRVSEHLTRVVTDHLPARVSYWDRSLRCRFANRAFCQAFGVSREDVIGRAMAADMFGEERLPQMLTHVDGVLRGKAQEYEMQETGADGQPGAHMVHYVPDLADDGSVRGFFALAVDVTELRQARDLAQDASQAKTRFLSNMSHELRTPMNAVLGMLALLQSTPLDARQREYASTAHGAAQSLLALLNDVLDLSKIEAGKMVLNPHPFGFAVLMRNLQGILSANLGGKPLEMVYEVDPALPPQLLGDDMRLRQILLNLGSNAIKFTEQGRVVIAARQVERRDARCMVELSVRDTGIGMSGDELKRLFQDFGQATETTSRRYGGTGLGLSICRRLARLMGSEIEVESVPGRGTCLRFTVLLPVVIEAAPPARGDYAYGAAVQPLTGIPQHGDLAGLRLLLAEDNPINQKVAMGLLSARGAYVHVVPDGRQAVNLLEADPGAFDAVLMDVQMPVLDGLSATREIRQRLGLAQLPVIAMTANALDNDRTECLASGMNDHVGKPFEVERLVRVILRCTSQVLDKEKALGFLGGEEALWDRLVPMFRSRLMELACDLPLQMQGLPQEEKMRLLHTLKGQAAMLGAEKLAHAAGSAEAAIRHGSRAADHDLREVADTIDATLRALDEHRCVELESVIVE